MTKSLSTAAVAAICLLTSGSASFAGQKSLVPDDYKQVWADEFEGSGLPDDAKWAYDIDRNRQGWYNNEKQYYASRRLENARVENGNLIIEARADAAEIAKFPDWGKQTYSSARLRTYGKASWTYGAVEVRAKLPCGRGSWPAIWMLPDDMTVPWPDSGEIDIMEHVGFDPGKVHFSLHTKAANFITHTEKTSVKAVDTACNEMHRYQMVWSPYLIVMGVDDQRTFSFKRPSMKRADWPFDGPFHILLNVAVGGDWGGQKGIDEKGFPQRMEVDYVRVYQKPGS